MTITKKFHKKKSHYKKKTYKKKKTSASKSDVYNKISTLTLHKGVNQLFPDRMLVKMKNEFAFTFTGTAGATNAYMVYANGLHLPLSGVLSGAVPITAGVASYIYGLGNLLSVDSAFNSTGPYEYYRIHSNAIKCRVQGLSVGINDAAMLNITPVDGNSLGALGNISGFTASEFAEMPYSKTVTVAGQTVNKGVIIKHAISVARLYALKYKSQIEANEYTGYWGTNPPNTVGWVFTWFPATANNTSAQVLVQMEYWVEFFNRNTLASTQG